MIAVQNRFARESHSTLEREMHLDLSKVPLAPHAEKGVDPEDREMLERRAAYHHDMKLKYARTHARYPWLPVYALTRPSRSENRRGSASACANPRTVQVV